MKGIYLHEDVVTLDRLMREMLLHRSPVEKGVRDN